MYFTANAAHRYGRVPEKHFFKHRAPPWGAPFSPVGLRSALAPPTSKPPPANQNRPTANPPATRQH